MNSKKADLAWQRIVAAARTVHSNEETALPYGFSTRVASLAFSAPTPFSASLLFERLSWKALAVSALLMILCLASTLPFLSSSSNRDEESVLADPVSEVVDIGG